MQEDSDYCCELRDIHSFIIEKTTEGRSIKYVSMSEKIPLGFAMTLICGCRLKESEWQQDEILIGKVRRRESRWGKDSKMNKVERAISLLFHLAFIHFKGLSAWYPIPERLIIAG